MNRKKPKNVLLLFLVFVLAFSIFAACGRADSGSTQTPPDVPAGSRALDEHITFTVAFWDYVTNDCDLMRVVEDHCNVSIVPMPISWDNDLEQIQLFAAADDLPDSTATYGPNTSVTRFYQWIDQGLVRSIPYEMISKYPLLKQLTDTSDAVSAIKDLKDNKYWYIPRLDSPQGLHKASQSMIYYRKDWLEAVGITKVPETLDEAYDMWRAFTYDDPDGNGRKDTFGLATPRGVPTIVTSFGTDPSQWYQDDDGQWKPGYFLNSMIEPLEYVQKMFQEGILDPEYQFAGWSQAVEKITTNVAGSLLRNGDINWVHSHIRLRWGAANPDVEDPLTVWDIMPPPKVNAEKTAIWPAKLDTGANEISSKVDDAKLDRIMYVMEYVLSPEGQALKNYGIEGVSYDIVNGRAVLRIDPDTGEPYTDLFPGAAFFNWVEWGFDYLASEEMYVGPMPPAYRTLALASMELYDAARDPRANFMPRLMSTPSKDMLDISWGDALMGIIVGSEPVSAAFARFQQEALAQGLQAAIDEVTAGMKSLGY